MAHVDETTAKEGHRSEDRSAFWLGVRDGLASVVFPASAHRAQFTLGSPAEDRRRLLATRLMLRARRTTLRKKELEVLAAAIRDEARRISSRG